VYLFFDIVMYKARRNMPLRNKCKE